VSLPTLIADLVGETAEGVREASVAAARRRAALAVDLSAEPTEADVDDALAVLFPPLRKPPVDLLARVLDRGELDEYVSTWRPGRTSVRAGGLYLHPELADGTDAKHRVAEFPPIERELGVSVLRTVERSDGIARLTERSVALVEQTVRDRLDRERRTAAAAFADGVPTPVVESATVEARVAFTAGEDGIETTLPDDREGGIEPAFLGTVAADLRFEPVRPEDEDRSEADGDRDVVERRDSSGRVGSGQR
jgi:hypothetical protein